MEKMLSLGVFLAVSVMVSSASELCVREKWSTTHYWIDGHTTHDYFKVDKFGSGTDIKLQLYNQREHDKYSFVTSFYRCGYKLYMSTMVQSKFAEAKKYIYNNGDGPRVDLRTVDSTQIRFNTDGRIYHYKGGSALEYASLGSERSEPMQYVRRGDSAGHLVFGSNERFWETIPFVTDGIGRDFISKRSKPSGTALVSSLTYGNITKTYALYADLNSTQLVEVDTNDPKQEEFRFEPIVYRLYKHINKKGRLIIRKAVVLRREDLQQYITLNVTEDGEVRLPYTHHTTDDCIKYNFVEFNYYDDEARGNLSSFLTADIRDQNVVDERFFEVIKKSRNTFQLVSTLHPDRYLATLDKGDEVILVVTKKKSRLPASIINFNFHLTNLGPKKVKNVRRLPTFSSCSLRPRKYYHCRQ